jgi:1-phosphofructokinase
MIYTLTLNPALDHIVRLEHLDLGETNRMNEELIKAGGKGINVSKLLKNLGQESTVLGYAGGFTGDELERSLEKDDGLTTDLIHVQKGVTRINVKIKEDVETEINGPGLDISKAEVDELFDKLALIEDGDYLFLSGSIPEALGQDFYKKIMEKLKGKDVKIIVDASGKALEEALTQKPYLIKPNLRELEWIFGLRIEDKKDLCIYSKKLQEMGARNIIVSLGKDGAYMLDENKREYFAKAPEGDLVDSVGSGDSMVAGFVYGMDKGFGYEEAFKFSIASGSATAFSEDLGTKEEIYTLYEKFRR